MAGARKRNIHGRMEKKDLMLDWSAMKKVLIKSQLVTTRKDIMNIYATGELK
jgi:hypothetical protein